MLQNLAGLRHLLMCHRVLSFFPYCLEMFSYALTAPTCASVSSKVPDRTPNHCAPLAPMDQFLARQEGWPEEPHVNNLCIYNAHAQTCCTFPIQWLSNLTTRWESLPLSATITSPRFLPSIFHKSLDKPHKVWAILPTPVNHQLSFRLSQSKLTISLSTGPNKL